MSTHPQGFYSSSTTAICQYYQSWLLKKEENVRILYPFRVTFNDVNVVPVYVKHKVTAFPLAVPFK